MSIDIEHLRSWIGREEEATGHASGWQAAVMQATLDRVPPAYADGDPLPPGWHVFYFPEVVRLAETGPDGHRRRGEFLPPVPLPVGERLTRLSRITAVEMKEGRSGPLVFVTTEHTISGENGVATRDEHVAVYRGPGVAAGARKGNDAPAEPAS